MGKKGLSQYKGELNATEITLGINAARRNATRLAEDASLLIDNKRYPSGLALAILSIEESGKPQFCVGLRWRLPRKSGKKLGESIDPIEQKIKCGFRRSWRRRSAKVWKV